MRKLLLILFFVLLLGRSYARERDTTYISAYSEKFALKGFSGRKVLSFVVSADEGPMVCSPNTPQDLGVGFSWNGFGLSLSYGFGFTADRKRERSKIIDLQLHHYARTFLFDGYLQDYRGFSFGDRIDAEFLPHMRLTQIGGTFQYVLNHHRFSCRAVFNQSEKQRRSAGSLLLGGGLYYADVEADEVATKEREHNFFLGPTAGYVYCWIIKKNFYVSIAFSAGANLGLERLDQALYVYPVIGARFSAGYTGDTWAIGVSGIANTLFVDAGPKTNMNLNSQLLRVTFSHRFDIPYKKNAIALR